MSQINKSNYPLIMPRPGDANMRRWTGCSLVPGLFIVQCYAITGTSDYLLSMWPWENISTIWTVIGIFSEKIWFSSGTVPPVSRGSVSNVCMCSIKNVLKSNSTCHFHDSCSGKSMLCFSNAASTAVISFFFLNQLIFYLRYCRPLWDFLF